MIRPSGLSAGSTGLLLAWLGGAAIARLTGATAVVILLTVGAVTVVGAIIESRFALRAVDVGDPVLPAVCTQGEPAAFELTVDSRRPVRVDVRVDGAVVASGWCGGERGTRWSSAATFSRRGVVDELDIGVRTGGSLGLWWWQFRRRLRVEPVVVAPAPADRDVPVDRRSLGGDGDSGGAAGAVSGEFDGIRPWRDGDSERWVHWASTIRSGELMVHDRRRPADAAWIVRPRLGTADPDDEAAAARSTIERGLRAGVVTSVAVGDAEPSPIPDLDAAARWSATVDLGPVERPGARWWQRSWTAEPASPASVWARHWSGAATFVALAMLVEALGLSGLLIGPIAVVVALAAVVSGRSLSTGEPPSQAVRMIVGTAALGGLAMVVASSGRVDGLLPFLRGPLPQVLIILILIHGFECRDRRTVRVSVGIAAVVVMYASAFRVDDRLALWLVLWIGTAAATLVTLSRPPGQPGATPTPPRRGVWPRRAATAGSMMAVSIALLAIVPVPDGPARLALPSLIEDGASPAGRDGALVDPDGDPADAAEPGDLSGPAPDRAPIGQSGGYTGFAESMDTSVRGSLSDDVVMRVRSPAAAFWRGQTFSDFDGRRWHADDEQGRLRNGPSIEIPLTFADVPETGKVVHDDLVQTYYIETDMPNLVFHAYRPAMVVLQSGLWVRGDGALRATSTLPAGSVYTVVSSRPRVDAQVLRGQGDVGERLNAWGREAFSAQLALPDSTSPDTIALADRLAEGTTNTYDLVSAYEAWMNANVEYDLDAPLPDAGEDAVHDFLFDSRLGFCEQIASAMTVMLRTQGVPARLAVGYTSGTRDWVTGVFEVKASDAHAWVEVWFPDVGWHPFDPTASVPLSADSRSGSIGGGLAAGAGEYAGEHGLQMTAYAGLAAGGWLGISLLRRHRYRRHRGRWGLLQDRFADGGVRRGAREGASNGELATVWSAAGDVEPEVARRVAERLDRVAFAPDFDDDDATFEATRRLVDTLPG